MHYLDAKKQKSFNMKKMEDRKHFGNKNRGLVANKETKGEDILAHFCLLIKTIVNFVPSCPITKNDGTISVKRNMRIKQYNNYSNVSNYRRQGKQEPSSQCNCC